MRHVDTPSSELPAMDAWSQLVIQAAKQQMLIGKHYLILVDGLPWHRLDGDSWVNDTWWIEAATASYQRFQQSKALYCTTPLTILLHYFPEKYCQEARSQLSLWWSTEGNHDPEYWWDLGIKIWPDHPMFEFLYECPETSYEYAILAQLDYKDSRTKLYQHLTDFCQEQDYYWVNDIIKHLAQRGGAALVKSVVPAQQLRLIKRQLAEYAKDKPSLSKQERENRHLVQESTLPVAILLGWQAIIDVLSSNSDYIQSIEANGLLIEAPSLLWWSLTDHSQIIHNFVSRHQPYKLSPKGNSVSQSQKLALAIAWTRIMAKRRP